MRTPLSADVRSRFPHTTFKSVSAMLSSPGVKGLFCTCYDVLFPDFGVVFYWDSVNGYWKAKPGEFLIFQEPDFSHSYVDTFTASSTVSASILMGTIPGGIIRPGQSLYLYTMVRGTSSPSPTTYLCGRVGNLITGGSASFGAGSVTIQQFPYSMSAYFRASRSDFLPGNPNELTWIVAGVDRFPGAVNFALDVPCYSYIQSPNIGATYQVLRTFLKVGD